MTDTVLDASAILAMVHREPGAEVVAEELPRAIVSAVNIAEVAARMSDDGVPDGDIQTTMSNMDMDVVAFDNALALACGNLRRLTRHVGLSLGDRACLALAYARSLPVLTADRVWAELNIGVEVRLIR
ncbi:MAG: type II toxin-antitoxin system VapC family toxin [Alphaproteobacteria bacterium]|nr:type II toxin-antitoxin system VapC family toxin [Alphaproteobacteria bacterium]